MAYSRHVSQAHQTSQHHLQQLTGLGFHCGVPYRRRERCTDHTLATLSMSSCATRPAQNRLRSAKNCVAKSPTGSLERIIFAPLATHLLHRQKGQDEQHSETLLHGTRCHPTRRRIRTTKHLVTDGTRRLIHDAACQCNYELYLAAGSSYVPQDKHAKTKHAKHCAHITRLLY